MQAAIDYIVANKAAIFAIWQGLFVALSLVFQLVNMPRVSKVFGSFAIADLGRFLRYAQLFLEFTKAQKEAAKTTAVSLFVAFSLLGCHGSFNEARMAGAKARSQTPAVSLSSPQRCQSLSDRQYWFTGSGVLMAATGAAAAGLTLPAKSDGLETGLAITAASAGVLAGTFTWLGTQAGSQYVEECK